MQPLQRAKTPAALGVSNCDIDAAVCRSSPQTESESRPRSALDNTWLSTAVAYRPADLKDAGMELYCSRLETRATLDEKFSGSAERLEMTGYSLSRNENIVKQDRSESCAVNRGSWYSGNLFG